MTTTPFEHSPLDADDPKAIQIIELLPSINLKGPICCELRHSSLDEDVQYEALSYAWGEPEPGHTVFVNGPNTLDVTRNCLEALTSLRRRFHRRSLWVDAICIDQREEERSRRERDRQIKIMDDVFGKATKVLVWLGPSEPTSARTMTMLKCMAMLRAARETRRCYRSSALGAIEKYLSTRMVKTGTMDSYPQLRYHAFASMICSPWWRRVWTLQEQCLARECEAYQGRQSISFSSLKTNGLERTIDYLTGGRFQFNYFVRHLIFESNATHDTSQQSSLDPWLLRLLDDLMAGALLEIAFYLEARHPVDKIYGLHSLFTTYCNLPLSAPDYNKTAEAVYEETVCVWINTRRDLGILKLAARPGPVHKLPSWVPAWHQQHPRYIHSIDSSERPTSWYRGPFTQSHFDWVYPDPKFLFSGVSSSRPRGIRYPLSVASFLSPGKLRVLQARFAGRVSHALGPNGPQTRRQYTESIECCRVNLNWCRLVLGFFSHNTTMGEEALHEMFKCIWRLGKESGRFRYDETPEGPFESFQAWFDFLLYLNKPSDLPISLIAEDAGGGHGRRCVEDFYFAVCVAEQEDEATNTLESDFRGDVQGREGLTKLARHIRSVHRDLAMMRNRSLCILNNDNMIAITGYWCQEGDEVFVFPEADSPYVLRKAPGGDGYRLIGPALIDRLWRVGYQKWRSEGVDLQEIVLI